MRSPAGSTMIAETGERRPGSGRDADRLTPSPASSARIASPARSSPRRVASVTAPPSRAAATAAFAAMPPPTTSSAEARCLVAVVGIAATP